MEILNFILCYEGNTETHLYKIDIHVQEPYKHLSSSLKCRNIVHFCTCTNFPFQSLLMYFPFFPLQINFAKCLCCLHKYFKCCLDLSHYSPIMTRSRSDAEVGLYLTKFIFSGLHDSFQARIKRRLSIVEYFLNHVSCLGSKESPELQKCKSINQ